MKKKVLIVLLSLAMIVTLMPASAFAAQEHNAKKINNPVGRNRCLPGGSFDLVTLDDVAENQPAKDKKKKSPGSDENSDQTKTMPLLMIVVGFNNVAYGDDYDWGSTVFSDQDEDRSLQKYYLDNSYGKFTFVPAKETSHYVEGEDSVNTNIYDRPNDGIVHVSLDMDHDDWTGCEDEEDYDAIEEHDATLDEALTDAMEAADKYVDFSQYDYDSDGEIETNEMAVGFIFAGGEASNSLNREMSSWNKLLWAHASYMDARCDGKDIGNYIAIGENLYYEDGSYDDDDDGWGFEPYSDSWSTEAKKITLNRELSVDTSDGDGIFTFTPSATGWYEFYSKPGTGNESSDPAGRVLDQEGNLIARGDDSHGDDDEDDYDEYQFRIIFYAEQGQTYYLQAKDWEGETVFYVGVVETVEPEEDNHGFEDFSENWATQAEAIEIDQEKNVNTAQKDGLFKFVPIETGWYSFYSYGGNVDAKGRVLDETGSEIEYNDDRDDDEEDTQHFEVLFHAEAGETYYLQAKAYEEDAEIQFSVKLVTSEDPGYDDDDDEDDEEWEPYIEQAGINQLAHELGHYLGLADYYDVDYDDSGAWGQYEVGQVSVMASGSWSYIIDDKYEMTYRPSEFDAYSKVTLGWVEPTEVTSKGTYAVNAAGADNSVLKIPTSNKNEYYLIENRQFTGWDEALKVVYHKDDIEYVDDDDDDDDYNDDDGYNSPKKKDWEPGSEYPNGSRTDTGGLVIWHVDQSMFDEYMENNRINTRDHRPALMPVSMEYDEYGKFIFKGAYADMRKIFFDSDIYSTYYAATAGSKAILPVYGSATRPSARRNGETVISFEGSAENAKVKIEGVHEHTLVETQASAADCTTDGNTAYWKCRTCGRIYTDSNASIETTLDDVTIEALGHDFGDWTKVSDTMHERVCSRNASHIERETHTWNKGVITKEATSSEKGTKLFTCTKCGAEKEEEYSASSGGGGGGGTAGDSDQTAADDFTAKVNALPAADRIAISDKAAITSARAAYNALTTEQKALVSAATLSKLESAESALRSLEAIQAAEDAVDAIPETVSTSDRDAITKAQSLYDALSDAEKTKFNSEKKSRLDASVAALANAELKEASYINKASVTKADIQKASDLGATSVTFGPKVKKITKNSFKGTSIKTVIVKTKKLTKAKVKGSFKGSKVKTIKVKVSNKKKTNKKYVKKYKKIFTKKNAGKKVSVK